MIENLEIIEIVSNAPQQLMSSGPEMKNTTIKTYKTLIRTQAPPQYKYKTTRSQTKFKPSHETNCQDFGNFQHFKELNRHLIELPPIVFSLDTPQNSTHKITKIPQPQTKRKPNSPFKIRHISTQRGHYQTKKPTNSMKSTSNQSRTKSLSSEQVQEGKTWKAMQVQTAPEKFGDNLIALHNNQEVRLNKMRNKNMEKCLIGHSKNLPFSLEKKRVTKRLSFAEKHEGNKRYQVPFELNLSNILCKRESRQFLDQEMQNLTVLLS